MTEDAPTPTPTLDALTAAEEARSATGDERCADALTAIGD